jgi:hypothetical protein
MSTPRIINETRRFDELVCLMANEAGYGVGGELSGADAFLLQNVEVTPLEAEVKERQFYRPDQGNRPFVLVGKKMRLRGDVELAGSGDAAIAPKWSRLLIACGRQEVARAATADATIAGAAVAGAGAVGTFTYTRTVAYSGTQARTITLTCTTGGASAAATFTVSAPATPVDAAINDVARVMTDATPFVLGQGASITPEVGVAFEVGDTYTIALEPAGYEWRKSSDSWGHGSIVMETYLGPAERHRSVGMRGTFTIDGTNEDYPRLHFNLVGFFTVPTGDAPPVPALTAFQKPLVFGFDHTPIFTTFGIELVGTAFTFDAGNDADLKSRQGQALVPIKAQKPTMSLTFEQTPLDVVNFYALAASEVPGAVTVQHGRDSGEIVGVAAPAWQLRPPRPQNDDGDYMLQLEGPLLDVATDDAVVIFAR